MKFRLGIPSTGYVASSAILLFLSVSLYTLQHTFFYQNCIYQSSEIKRERVPQSNDDSIAIDCVVTSIDHFNGVVSALGTLVIAIFTIIIAFSTRRQTMLTREALIADKRAFLFAHVIKQEWTLNTVTNTFDWRFRTVWENSGETPTKQARICTHCVIMNTALPAGYVIPDEVPIGVGLWAPKYVSTAGIAPHLGRPPITARDIADVQSGNKFLYVMGWAKYFDVFANTEHTTRFCVKVNVLGDAATFIPDTKEHALRFDFHQHDEGNSAE